MNKSTILAIAKKEFFGFLNSPLSFVITVPFLLISTFIYFQTSLTVGEASLRPYFEMLPWFLLFLAPALSMRLLTDEQRAGTIELLYAHPVSEAEIVLGKFAGAMAFFLTILATTLGLPLTILTVSNPDPGTLIAQYLGAIFVGATFLSIGILCSAYVKNAIGSFLLAVSISFVLILLGIDFVTLLFPWPASRVVEEIAILPHMTNIARGLLDIRDILYFVTVSGLFLTATVMKLSERKIKESKKEKSKLTLALGLIVGIGVALNVFMSFYPLRLDLTQQRLFSLSEGTKQTLSKLPDLVTVTVYASRTLPGPMQLTYKEIHDTLKDYQRFGSRLQVKTVYPDADAASANEARQLGIQEVSFNKIATGKFEVQTGFLGIAARYGDKTEVLPFVQDTSDLEYQLTRRIRKLTQTTESEIGIYTTSAGAQYQIISELAGTQYKVTQLTDPQDLLDENKSRNLRALVAIDDGSAVSTASAAFKTYLDKGGRVLFLANGVAVDPQSLNVVKSSSQLSAFLPDYGITLKNNLVYDVQLNETLTFNGGNNVRYIAPYPFWIRALPEDTTFPAMAGIKTVTLPWTSTLGLSEKSGITYKKLLTSSPTSGTQEETFRISPQDSASLAQPKGVEELLAVSAEKGEMKLIVVANANLVNDQFLQSFQDNIAFLANSVDYLASDKDLASIPRKTSGRAVYQFKSALGPVFFQYGNILIPPVLVIAFALMWLSKRRKLTLRKYHRVS